MHSSTGSGSGDCGDGGGGGSGNAVVKPLEVKLNISHTRKSSKARFPSTPLTTAQEKLPSSMTPTHDCNDAVTNDEYRLPILVAVSLK